MQSRIIAVVAGVITLTIGIVLGTVVTDITANNAEQAGGDITIKATDTQYVGKTCDDLGTIKCSAATRTTNLVANDVISFPQISSFAGAGSIMDLIPLIYYTAIVMLGVGMIGIGAGGMAGYGPMRNG